MTAPPIAKVESDSAFPKRLDAAIIGGGIAGLTTAMELMERGLTVAVFEKGVISGEQSGRNWGWCRKMGRDSREVPLSKISLDLWANMNHRVDGETGFVRSGVAYLCETEGQMADRQKWFDEQAKPHELSTQMISAEQANALTPGANVSWKGGMVTPDDGRAEPQLAVPAMARYLRQQVGLVFQNCAVRDIERKGGRICGIVTERGAVDCEMAILAGGVWSRRFAHNIGVHLPQVMVLNSVVCTAPVDSKISTSIGGGEIAVRRRLDGGFTVGDSVYNVADILPDHLRLARHFVPTLMQNWGDFRFRIGKRFLDEAKLKRRWKPDEISPFEQVRTLAPEPNAHANNTAIRKLHRLYPEFRNVAINNRWAGAIDVVPDVVPVIDKVDQISGLNILTGLSGHGFGLGPGAGKLMAQIALGEAPCVDPTPFRLGRF